MTLQGTPLDETPVLSTPVGPRRRFFAWVTTVAMGIIGIGLAIPLIGYVVGPALKRREALWNEIGPIDRLRTGEPEEVEFVNSVKDGWRQATVKKVVWAIKQSADTVVVFSPICPHLGCGYRWDGDEKKFKCPCHGSVYAVTGKVLAGPAPRPLDVLPSKVEQGRLWVKYQQFKSGLDHPVEL
ncbi:MAG: hypothetical protein OJF47_002148 [Nitrospira sp.]|jgi:menaquinol-cytochrome c reductase iron-sulfur subunit|nr:MAG: hypothetical protein OJF47_002148 [Nitrospira sp.]